jgi:hypothetical protein
MDVNFHALFVEGNRSESYMRCTNTSWVDLGSHKTLTAGSSTMTQTLMVDQKFLSTMSFSISSHCHKKGSATMLLICLTHYIHTYRPIGSDNLEWSIIRRTSLFAKFFHDDGIAKLPTLQGSLGNPSLPSCLTCVSISLISFTTCEERSRCSGYG